MKDKRKYRKQLSSHSYRDNKQVLEKITEKINSANEEVLSVKKELIVIKKQI